MNIELFLYSVDLVNDLINYYDGLSYDSSDTEDIRRLERAHDYLSRAMVVLTPIYYKHKGD